MDIEDFRATLPVPATPPTTPPVIRRPMGQFIKGPIPMDWIAKAAKLEGKTLHVGLELWRESGCRRSQIDIPLSMQKLKQFGVGRQAAHAALGRLEAAKLVTVIRRSGCLARVAILDVEDDDRGQPDDPQATC